ncbi:MAG: hypothetical protein JW737_05755 [Acidobacteria bacterium]|nr:hypothetical protein [Acidobacteriota bacterium]
MNKYLMLLSLSLVVAILIFMSGIFSTDSIKAEQCEQDQGCSWVTCIGKCAGGEGGGCTDGEVKWDPIQRDGRYIICTGSTYCNGYKWIISCAN